MQLGVDEGDQDEKEDQEMNSEEDDDTDLESENDEQESGEKEIQKKFKKTANSNKTSGSGLKKSLGENNALGSSKLNALKAKLAVKKSVIKDSSAPTKTTLAGSNLNKT